MIVESTAQTLRIVLEVGPNKVIVAVNTALTLDVPVGKTVSFGKHVKDTGAKYRKRARVITFPVGIYFLAITPTKNGKGLMVKRLDIIAKDKAEFGKETIDNQITQLINMINEQVEEWKKVYGPDFQKIREKGSQAITANLSALFATIAVLSRISFNGQLANYLMNLDKESEQEEQK